ncbi:hypothetical protein VTN77DRAFT_289 [Rasamsonia byssochlamydoides]|uniref:uncharacterized protein n=1 Tax=Rasamsonia byssochlamydoides TaxID=89139 RepID=UPI0037420A9E
MPLRRPTFPLIFEELSTNDSDIDGVLGSDDELDESTRAAKRRRIEKLGESYLQGKPLFIASAALRGPFDDGWVNPWKKQRKQRQASPSHFKKSDSRTKAACVEGRVIPETDEKKRATKELSATMVRSNRPGDIVRKGSSVISDPATDNHRGSEVSNPREASVASGASSNARKKQRRSLPWVDNTTESTKPEPSSSDRIFRNDWLRKDKKTINIRDVDPPKSPTPLYAGRRDSIQEITRKSSHTVTAPISSRNGPPWPPDLRGAKRLKPSPRNSSNSSHVSGLSPRGDTHDTVYSPIADEADTSRLQRNSSIAPAGLDVPVTSSVYIVPPSSHLPEFKYRRPKNPGRHEESSLSPSKWRRPAGRDRAGLTEPQGATGVEHSKGLPSPARGSPDPKHDLTYPNNHGGRPDSTRLRASIGPGVELTGSGNPPSNSTGSERIPSAQVVPGNSGLFDRMISLHSTEVHGDRDRQNGLEDDDAQLSTQAALLLAQKSFQDDLATPESRIQPKSAASHPDPPPSANKITPFSHINTTSERHGDNVPMTTRTEGFQPLNTQAMIDAVTPFTFSTSKKSEPWMEPASGLDRTVSHSKRKRKAIFELSSSPPQSVSFHSDGSLQQEDQPVNGIPGKNMEGPQIAVSGFDQVDSQHSVQGSSHALPLTLSGSTPTTEQQDGQGLIAGMDSFNINQVIQDAGSWLQQSWDVERDLRRCSGKSAQSSSAQTQRVAVSFDALT